MSAVFNSCTDGSSEKLALFVVVELNEEFNKLKNILLGVIKISRGTSELLFILAFIY